MWTLSPKAAHYRAREQAGINARLKAAKQDPVSEYELDLRCFRQTPFGDAIRNEFLLRCYEHQWPSHFVIESDGRINPWVVRMSKAFCRFKRLNFLGCASSGKSYNAAAYAYTAWKSNPLASSVYLSTTSAEAGEARAFGTIKDLFAKDRHKIGKLISSLRVITLDEEMRNEEGNIERDYRNCVKAVLIKPGKEGENAVGTICGRKNENVIWVVDELPFMPPGVLEARVNLFSNPFAQWIGIGNAPEEGDPLYIDGEPFGPEFPDGWRSVDHNLHEHWPSKTGYTVYFNGLKSPNLSAPKGRKPPFPRIMDHDKLAEIELAAGGPDTNIFWKQAIGFPPSVDVPDKVITSKLLMAHNATDTPLWEQPNIKTLAGLDLGFREDGDPCILDFGKLGKHTNGRTVLQHEKDGVTLHPIQNSKESFETQIARRVIEECRKPHRNCHDLALDVTGDGGMTLQAIERIAREENYTLNVTPVSFSGAAEDRIVIPGEKRIASQMFDRMVSQLWASYRVSVINGVIFGCDLQSKAVSQLCSRKFTTDDRKRFSVESKKIMKKRIKRSPDHGDARVLCHHLALRHGLSGMETVKRPPAQEKREESPAARQGYAGHGTRALYGGR